MKVNVHLETRSDKELDQTDPGLELLNFIFLVSWIIKSEM